MRLQLSLSIIMSVSVACFNSLHAATFEGLPVTLDTLPPAVRAAIPITVTTDQFKSRLKQGGTVELVGNETNIGSLDQNKKTLGFLALDQLILRNGATIITNGNALVIFANKIISEDGKIISYKSDNIKGGSNQPITGVGQPGAAGKSGLSGGLVSIHVLDTVEGILHVSLAGQDGGDGLPGNKGGPGGRGERGQDAADDIIIGGFGTGLGSCKHSGGNGGPGTQGLPGGPGGQGGSGGDGGYFELTNVGSTPLPGALTDFSGSGGQPGLNGKGGPGGDGGPGGEGGSGSTYCGGGHGGPTGPVGSEGATLGERSRTGSPGQSIIKNLDIDVMIRTAVVPAQVAMPVQP